MMFRFNRVVVFATAAAACCAADVVHAGVTLRGERALVAALKTEPPCCVVDARSDAQRSQHPMPDALRYKPSLRIVPTASVVVIADDDAEATRVGAALARQHPGKTILAVQGGAPVWESVLGSLQASAASAVSGGGQSFNFVIPHNTCETGAPLQVLKSKAKP